MWSAWAEGVEQREAQRQVARRRPRADGGPGEARLDEERRRDDELRAGPWLA